MKRGLMFHKVWAILVILGGLSLEAKADTWEASISFKVHQVGILIANRTIDTIATMSPSSIIPYDFSFDYGCLLGSSSSCYYYFTPYDWATSNNLTSIFQVVDTSLLDFSAPLDTSDTNLFYASYVITTQEVSHFVLSLLSGNYAFCHNQVSSGSVYLACQVQDDGTTKFDSIPQYPFATSGLRDLPVRPSWKAQNSTVYGVNGTRISGNRRVFKIVNTNKDQP